MKYPKRPNTTFPNYYTCLHQSNIKLSDEINSQTTFRDKIGLKFTKPSP